VKKSAERSGLNLGEEKLLLREKLVQLQKKEEGEKLYFHI
jgi:hypothetical protein